MTGNHFKLLRDEESQVQNGADIEKCSDDELMLLLARDRKDAFEALLDRYQALVLGYATRFLGDGQTAEDVTQEVFLRIWKDRANYRPEGRFISYMLSIAFHFLRDLSKRKHTVKKSHNEIIKTEMGTPAHLPLDQLLEKERSSRLHKHLLALNENTRSALLFRYGAELSYEEIAATMSQPVGTVKSCVFRGIRELNAMLALEDKK